MINHHSIKTHHDLAKRMPISYAAGVEAENNHQRIERERAIATRARNKAYWQKTREQRGSL